MAYNEFGGVPLREHELMLMRSPVVRNGLPASAGA
jgi:hypothetical protein